MDDDLIFTEIPADRIRRRLDCIETYLPDEPKYTYRFCHLLSKHFETSTNPLNFFVKAHLLIFRLSTGYPAYSRCYPLTELLPSEYSHLERIIPRIAEAATPPDFAEKVARVYDELHSRAPGGKTF